MPPMNFLCPFQLRRASNGSFLHLFVYANHLNLEGLFVHRVDHIFHCLDHLKGSAKYDQVKLIKVKL